MRNEVEQGVFLFPSCDGRSLISSVTHFPVIFIGALWSISKRVPLIFSMVEVNVNGELVILEEDF